MILTVFEVSELPGYSSMSDAQITRKIEAVESAICAITHNDFKNRSTGAVVYPPDVVEGALSLLAWQVSGKEKAVDGIASETLSRHSVSYTAQDAANMVHGFPSGLLGFLQPYYKARF